jgi:hypothetical protein
MAHIYLVWGDKLIYRKVGYVAEYCPICREPRVCQLRQVRRVFHLYFIPLGGGDIVGYAAVCQTCKTDFSAELSDYARIAHKPLALDILRPLTFPDFDTARRIQLEEAEQMRFHPMGLSADERQRYIAHEIGLLAPKVERHFSFVRVDRRAVTAIVFGFIFYSFVPVILMALHLVAFVPAFLVCFLLAYALIGWQLTRVGPRFVQREVLPPLARALRALRPNEVEIQAALVDLRRQQLRIGSKVQAAALLAEIQKTPKA